MWIEKQAIGIGAARRVSTLGIEDRVDSKLAVGRWRAATDEDGYYCFAVALWRSGRPSDPAG
jgi:hypothetical protein